MSDNPYQAGGPLLADSPVYILREADEKAATHLRRMDYISLIEPRQHGKTSLINHLNSQFSTQGYIFAYRDMMAIKANAEVSIRWYTYLGKWLLYQAHPHIWGIPLASCLRYALFCEPTRDIITIREFMGHFHL